MEKLDVLVKYLGMPFTKYVLNLDSTDCRNITFTHNQIEVVNYIYELISKERLKNLEKNYDTESICDTKFLLTDDKLCIAHKLRKLCGGDIFVYSKSQDSILNYFGNKLTKCYPNFLLNSGKFMFATFSQLEKLFFKEQIKKDIIGKMLVKNKEGNERIAFSLKKQANKHCMSYVSDVENMFSTIMINSFNNCEYRLSTSPQSILEEMQYAVKMLRRIALSKNSQYSIFTGIKGIVFDGFNVIELPDMTIRYIGDALINEENINKTRIIIANQSKNNISGVIAETFHKVKLKKILKNTQYNSYEDSSDSESMVEAQYRVSNFNLAVLFTLNEFCKVTITFKQNGFWLRRSKPIYDRKNEGKIIIIGKEHISDIVKWYELLQKATYSTITESIINIKEGLLEEKDITDSIMNGFYAWEGMFSSSVGTTEAVVKGISKYINEDEQRISELYEHYRCHKAHGAPFKQSPSESLYEIKNEVFKIAIKCLKKLLQDSELIKLKPSNRYTKVLEL